MTHIHEVLDRHLKRLRGFANVLNVAIGTKFRNGKDTGIPAIVLYVSKKKPCNMLTLGELIPVMVEDIDTDVVELSSDDYVLGDTDPSKLSPEIQKRISNGVKNE
jgi:hypothetical protein